ncbi:MAG: glycosyl hydrolase, partial [Burkholderiales bacterium]|nr:glycosyl hydrolase [Burkholderiales bacterium]
MIAALRTAGLLLALAAAAGHAVPAAAPGHESAFRAPLAAKAPLLSIARAGARLVAVGDFGVVVLSDDDGRSWRQAQAVATRQMLTSVAFVDAQRGYAVGHGGTVLATADGGETWTRLHDAGVDDVLLSVWFGSAQRGLAVGAFGFALATADGGRT